MIPFFSTEARTTPTNSELGYGIVNNRIAGPCYIKDINRYLYVTLERARIKL